MMDASTYRGAPSLQESEFSGPGHGLGPAPGLKLAVNVAEVFFNGTDGHGQVLGNLLIPNSSCS
jgi:hypothetical protein